MVFASKTAASLLTSKEVEWSQAGNQDGSVAAWAEEVIPNKPLQSLRSVDLAHQTTSSEAAFGAGLVVVVVTAAEVSEEASVVTVEDLVEEVASAITAAEGVLVADMAATRMNHRQPMRRVVQVAGTEDMTIDETETVVATAVDATNEAAQVVTESPLAVEIAATTTEIEGMAVGVTTTTVPERDTTRVTDTTIRGRSDDTELPTFYSASLYYLTSTTVGWWVSHSIDFACLLLH